MKKDIFIDNNIAKNFSNPMDEEYKRLIRWLMTYDPGNSSVNAILVVSNKLLAEYNRTAMNATTGTNSHVIINKLMSEGRLVKISNPAIKEFKQKFFSKKTEKSLRSNKADHDHIPVVLLSDRKYALSLDDNFIYDLRHFPGFTVLVEKRPEKLPYDK